MASFGFHLWISSLIIIVLGSLNNDPRSEPAGARTTMACSADRLSDWLMASLHQVSQLLYRLRRSAHAKFSEKGVSTHLGRRPHNGPGRLLPQDVDHFVDRPATWPKNTWSTVRPQGPKIRQQLAVARKTPATAGGSTQSELSGQ